MRRVFASTALGLLIALAGAAFVVRELVDEWDDVRRAADHASLGWLVVAPFAAAAGMTAIAVPWADVIAALGASVRRTKAIAWYFVGELGKYVPGGVWPVLGRAELARREGALTRPVAYASVALSLVALYLGAMIVAVGLLPFGFGGDHDPGPALWLLLLLPAGLVALHPTPLGRAVALLEGVSRRRLEVNLPPWGRAVALVLRYLPAWLLIAGTTWSVARAFDPHAGLGRTSLATLVSWIAGFLAVPVPGGLGVREAVFTAAAGLDPGVAAATALIARVTFMVVDAGGAALGSVALRAGAREVPSRE